VNPIQSSRNRFFFVGGKNLVSISTAACKVFAAVDGRFLLQSQGEKGLEKAVERREFLSIVRGPIVLFCSVLIPAGDRFDHPPRIRTSAASPPLLLLPLCFVKEEPYRCRRPLQPPQVPISMPVAFNSSVFLKVLR